MAEKLPVVLVFEDLQWADSGLLDFIDYLLEWSAEFPIFMLALGRPELPIARPAWSPTISLDPLDEEAMTQLLGGLVPGLPEELASKIRRRSEGMPLYAVETVRMLLDRGLVAQEGARYAVTGDVADLEVPETLQALVAARLDNLDPAERALLQDAAVIGQSFTPATLIAVAERPAAEVQRLLDGLVAKQVLAFVDEPLSAERGQYVFLQALLRTIALGTLSRRDRKARHLAVARHLRDAWGEEAGDIAEVLASHYLDAVEADPDAPDAESIRASACQTLADAGRRALSLALGPEARRHFERAAELAGEPALRGRLLREAGTAARVSGELDVALELLTRSVEFLQQAGLTREAARANGLASEALRDMGRVEEAWERASAAYTAIDDGSDDEAVADLADRSSRIEFMRGNLEEALRLADVALRIADGMSLSGVLVMAMITKANSLAELARPSESTALLRHAAKIAVEEDLAEEAGRAYFNLADNLMGEGRYAEADELLAQGLELARRRGDRTSEQRLLSQRLNSLLALGRWDELLSSAQQLTKHSTVYSAQTLIATPLVLAARGDIPALRALEPDISSATGWTSVDLGRRIGQAVIARETGSTTEAAAAAEACEAMMQLIHGGAAEVPPLFAEAVECSFAAGEPERIADLLASVDKLKPAELKPLLDAEATRARARLAAHRGEFEQAEQSFKRAIALFQELGTPFFLARAQLEYAELMARRTPGANELASLRDEAEPVFEQLEAESWLARTRVLGSAVAA
jgi:tetratricopeptide (TPR) repeat protein